jgi:hypothetical protein
MGASLVVLGAAAGNAMPLQSDDAEERRRAKKQEEENARVANAQKSFDALKSGLRDFNSKFSETLVATVHFERLSTTRDKALKKKDGSWTCQTQLDAAKEKCGTAKKAFRSIAEGMKSQLGSAKGAAKGVPAARLPWGSSVQEMTKSVETALSLERDIDSSKTAEGKQSLARLWTKVQDYATKLPDCLPQAKAADMVPATTRVPCTGELVELRVSK